MPRHDASISAAAACGAVAPGPLHGLTDVLNAMDGAPLRSARSDARAVEQAVREAVHLIELACRDGSQAGGLWTPSLLDRRRAITEAAAVLAEAKGDLSALRKALDILVLLVGAAAALVEHQAAPEPPVP